MKSYIFFLVLTVGIAATLGAAEPKFIFENRPDSGLPAEAARQDSDSTVENRRSTLGSLMTGIDLVRVQYYRPAWKDQKSVQDYLAGLFSDASVQAQSHTQWSEPLNEPDIECQLRFDEVGTGKLYLWGHVGCLRDASGRWWFFRFIDYYEKHHPKSPGTA